jgi:glucose/mannose transport system permease protein
MPLYVVVVTAFKPLGEVVQGSMLALPAHWTLEPFQAAWSSACIGSACRGLANGIRNSLWISGLACVISVGLGAVTGYALSSWRLPGAHVMFGLLLAANMLPYQVILIPMTIALRTIGLFGTVDGLVLVHVVYGLPYMTLLFRNFYLDIPVEVVRAAQIDGGRFWSILLHVVLPMSKPMLFVAFVLEFTVVWDDYLFGLVFGGRDTPVTVLLVNLINSGLGEKEYNVNMAGVLVATLPVLIVYLFSGRMFLRGLTASATGQ